MRYPENVGDEAPEITGPKIFLTSSAAKEARPKFVEEVYGRIFKHTWVTAG